MKNFIVKFLTYIVSINALWKVLSPVSEGFRLLIIKRDQVNKKRKIQNLSIFSKLNELTVLNGPFKGMKYPSLKSAGSALYPKLLGSYEMELKEVMNTIDNKNYRNIIDIGCAEGYYAIGLAITNKESQIYAYDVNPKARQLCQAMAKLNGVEDRIQLKSFCSEDDIKNFPFKNKSLIICDCEGFEKELFSEKNIDNLKSVDLLIEVHDFIDINISTNLEKLFNKTHNIKKIESIDDIKKANLYILDQTESLSKEIKKILFEEGRPSIMQWFFCQAKT